MRRRFHWMVMLTFAAGIALAACGDDDGGGGGGGGDTGGADAGDAGGDTTVADTGADTTADTGVTDTGDRCEGGTACAGNSFCDDGQVCQNGCCVDQAPASCTRQDQICDSNEASNQNFLCDTDAGLCLARCNSATIDAAEDGACARGQWCFELASDFADPVANVDPALDGICITGDCNDNDFEGGDWTCGEGSAGTCYPVGNGASLCFGAGSLGEGAVCDPTSDQAADNCQPGLFCFNSECIAPCLYDDEDPGASCDGDDECVPVFAQSGDNTAGVCGTACEPFSTGQCGDDAVCDINIAGFSGEITAWACRELYTDGDGDPLPVRGYLEDCDPNVVLNQCGEGMLCFSDYQGDTTGTCTQLCDFVAEFEGEPAGCPPGEGDPVLPGSGETAPYTAFEELLPYEEVTPATGVTIDLVAEPAEAGDVPEVLATAEGDLVADTVNTFIAYHADGGVDVAWFEDWNDETTALTAGDAGLRAYNVSGDAHDLTRIDGVAVDLAAGTTGDWVDVELGDSDNTNLYVVGADFTIFDRQNTADWEGAIELVAFTQDATGAGVDPVRWAAYLVDAPPDSNDFDRESQSAMRFINASATVAGLSPDEIDIDIEGTSAYELENIAYGDVSDWYVDDNLGTEDYSVRITWAGDAEIAFDLDGLVPGDIVTVIISDGASGAPEDGDEEILILNDHPDCEAGCAEDDPRDCGCLPVPATDFECVARLTNVSDLDDVGFGVEDTAVLEDDALASGASFPAEDGALGFAPGAYIVAARDDGGDQTVAPDAHSDWLDGAADAIEAVAVADLSDASLAVIAGPIDIPTLDATNAWVQFLNAADDTSLRLDFRGDPLQICAPLAVEGLGACSWECDPYMPGVDFQNASGESTDRWEDNGCPHSTEDGVNYGCFVYTVGEDATGWPDEYFGYCTSRNDDTATGDIGDLCTCVDADGDGEPDGPCGDQVCNPDLFCIPLSILGVDTNNSACQKLCQPFSGGPPQDSEKADWEFGHSDCDYDAGEYCQTFGQAFGFCFEPTHPDLTEGDVCPANSDFEPCAADDTFCLQLPGDTQPTCQRLCATQLDGGCPDLPGDDRARTCVGGIFIAEWLGICDFE